MQDVLGWILIVLGILFLIVGLIDAIRKVFGQDPKMAGVGAWDFILELVKGGLGLVAVGLILLDVGLKMIGQEGFLDFTKESSS